MRNNNQFGIAPVLAPDVLRQQYQLQNNQALAQQLMQSEAPQGQMVSGHFVAPSWTQQLAAALRPAVGQKIMNQMPEQMAQLQQAQQQNNWDRFNSVFGGQGEQMGSAGMSPQDMAREFQIAQLMGMDKYAAERMKWNAPTNEQKNLGFLPEPQRNTLIAAPFINEAGKDGTQMVMGPNGQVQAFAVPGYSNIQAQNAGAVAGAQAQAQAQNRIVSVPDGNGGTVMMPEDQAISLTRAGQTGAPGSAPATGAAAAPGQLGTTLPETVINARSELGKVVNQAEQMISSIDGILNHPGLEGGTGLSSYLPSLSDNARDFDVRAAQLQGQAFLQAFESLKGGGQITEVEGRQATAAIARLEQAQSKEAYVESLKELRGILEKARNRAYEKARVEMPAGNAPTQGTQAPAMSREALLQEAKRRGLIK